MIERPDWRETGEPVPGTIVGGGEGGVLAPFDHPRNEALASRDAAISSSLVAELDPDLMIDWEKAGGLGHRLGAARRAAGQVVGALAAGDQARLLSDFDALPQAAQSVVFSELALEPDGSVRAVSDDEIARFGSTEEGAALVKSWGRDAARNVAILRTRLERIRSRAQAANAVDALERWFEELTPDAAIAIYRALVGRRP